MYDNRIINYTDLVLTDIYTSTEDKSALIEFNTSNGTRLGKTLIHIRIPDFIEFADNVKNAWDNKQIKTKMKEVEA